MSEPLELLEDFPKKFLEENSRMNLPKESSDEHAIVRGFFVIISEELFQEIFLEYSSEKFT